MEFDPHFLRPLWLLALVPVAVLFWFYQRRARADSHWQNAVDDELLEALLDDETTGRAPPGWPLALATAAIIVGLAGPTWERLPQPVEQKTDALVIGLDLSLSMYATDVQPSRLVRARQEIIDVLRTRNEGYTALVAYAGSAHTVAPLTDDVRTIQNLLDALEPAMMPVQGSNPRAAMRLIQELFANARVNQGRVLLVTDGVDDINDVTEFRSAAYPVSVLGIGTPAGGPIPLDFVNQPGRFLQTREGEQITARLDDDRLSTVAELAYGTYARQTLDDSDIATVLATTLPGDDETVDVEREFDLWHDLGYWLAVAALPVLLLGFRRGVLAGCALVIAPIDAHASVLGDVWDDLWQRPDQQGHYALRHGEPERAATMFEDGSWLSVARYRSGDFTGAANGFAAAPDITSTYNLGNALAKSGDLKSAIAAYDNVLERDPTHEDAAFNKALAEKLLEEQEDASEEDNQEQQQDSDNQSQSERDSDGSPNDEEQDQEQSPDDASEGEEQAEANEQPQEPQPGEEGEEEQNSDQLSQPRDESEEAMEQWLRRVPDDPGGLMRRKFQFENQQRLRRGDYSNRQREKIW